MRAGDVLEPLRRRFRFRFRLRRVVTYSGAALSRAIGVQIGEVARGVELPRLGFGGSRWSSLD